MESSNFSLDNLMKTQNPALIVRSLQVHLGYSVNTELPTIDEFIEDDFYLGKMTNNGKGIYAYWRDILRDIFPNPLYTNYDTVFLRSAIGTGKSSVARIMLLYVLQKMLNMENPHEFYGLMPNKDLIVFLYSLQKSTISSAMYAPLTEMIDDSPFFKSKLDITRKGYKFRNKISIDTGSTIAKNVGKDIFLVWMDEIQEERMKNQNIKNYNSLKARVKSRFMLDGGVFFNSLIIMSGSPGGAEGMAERLTNKATDDERALINNAAQWEVLCSKIKYSGETFKVFVGNDSNEPRILGDATELAVYEEMLGEDGQHLILNVPVEYRKDFEDDILIAIRDIAGSVTRSSLSYITNVEKLRQAFSLRNKFFNIDVIKLPFFDGTQIRDYLVDPATSLRKRIVNPDNYRFIHIDIGVVSDLTGIAMSHIAGFVDSKEFNITTNSYTNTRDPWFVNDFNVGISRNKNEETNISKIRDFVIYLRDSGINIHTVTVDGYQSTQLRQELISHGIKCEVMSVTRTSKAFDYFKRAVYTERINLVKNASTQKEFLQFKKVITRQGKVKVVHPSTSDTGSHGDIAEALVGSVYSAYERYKSGIDVLSGMNFDRHRASRIDQTLDPLVEDEFSIIAGL